MAAVEPALHDPLDLIPDPVEALYPAFSAKICGPLRDRVDGLQKSSPDQKARKAAELKAHVSVLPETVES